MVNNDHSAIDVAVPLIVVVLVVVDSPRPFSRHKRKLCGWSFEGS